MININNDSINCQSWPCQWVSVHNTHLNVMQLSWMLIIPPVLFRLWRVKMSAKRVYHCLGERFRGWPINKQRWQTKLQTMAIVNLYHHSVKGLSTAVSLWLQNLNSYCISKLPENHTDIKYVQGSQLLIFLNFQFYNKICDNPSALHEPTVFNGLKGSTVKDLRDWLIIRYRTHMLYHIKLALQLYNYICGSFLIINFVSVLLTTVLKMTFFPQHQVLSPHLSSV